jgi:hypothetical protein
LTRLLAVEFLPHTSPPDQFYSDIVRAYSLCDTLSRTDCPISLASENKGTLTPSSRRRSCGRVVIIVVFFVVVFIFILLVFFLVWLLAKEDIGSYRPIRMV